MRTPRHLVVVAVAALAAGTLAGCTAAATVTPPTTAPIASNPAATTSANEPTGTGPSTPATSAAPAPSASADSLAAPTSPATSAPSGVPPCTSGALSASLGPGGGAAAGTAYVDLVLTSTSSRTCALQGWPGVSLVGDGNGTQIGAAADRDAEFPRTTVTLSPGGSAHARLAIANALNYPTSTCTPVTADGLRVYPPGETHALFIPTGFTACRNAAVHLLLVTVMRSSFS